MSKPMRTPWRIASVVSPVWQRDQAVAGPVDRDRPEAQSKGGGFTELWPMALELSAYRGRSRSICMFQCLLKTL